jgi:hypothetical protein
VRIKVPIVWRYCVHNRWIRRNFSVSWCCEVCHRVNGSAGLFSDSLRAKTALSTSTNAETLTVCKLSSSYLSLNSDIRTNCATTRKNCWVVPLNTTDYFNRCIWTRQQTQTQVETCVSPPALANRSRDDLVAAGLWSQCVSRTVVTLTVSTEPAQSNPALDMLFSCVILLCSYYFVGGFLLELVNLEDVSPQIGRQIRRVRR